MPVSRRSVTGQGSPAFPFALQPQPPVRSFELPVAGQGTPRPPTKARTAHTDKDKDDWITDVLDTITDVILDGQREDRRPQSGARLFDDDSR